MFSAQKYTQLLRILVLILWFYSLKFIIYFLAEPWFQPLFKIDTKIATVILTEILFKINNRDIISNNASLINKMGSSSKNRIITQANLLVVIISNKVIIKKTIWHFQILHYAKKMMIVYL